MFSGQFRQLRPRPVNILRLLWILLIAWYELGTFYHHAAQCKWPDTSLASHSVPSPTHVLLVADPQVLDHRSYPGRAPWLMWLSQRMVDLNLRKSCRATKQLKPDTIVFLGDMMDGGRFAMPDDEYEMYYRRFRHIFNTETGIPVYYIPGNHDTGLGTSTSFSSRAQQRYASHFGSLNQILDIANHTFVLIDAPDLAEEDDRRAIQGVTYTHWAAATPGGPIEFVESFNAHKGHNPTILLTHIPLARPEGASCGPLRERGIIRQGTGFGYQNTLRFQATQFLLQNIRPSAVFSGDDHDYCEYVHEIPASGQGSSPSPSPVKEISVKSFSMAMGIRRPGFQLLSLVPPEERSDEASAKTLADVPCLLPDQLGIYLYIYVPLIIFSILTLLFLNIHRVLKKSDLGTSSATTSPSTSRLNYDAHWPGVEPDMEWSAATPASTQEHFLLRKDATDIQNDDIYSLPTPGIMVRGKQRRARTCSKSWTFVLFGRRRRMTIDSSFLTSCSPSSLSSLLFSFEGGSGSDTGANLRQRGRRGFVRGFVSDMCNVAWPPVAVFAGITWWMFR